MRHLTHSYLTHDYFTKRGGFVQPKEIEELTLPLFVCGSVGTSQEHTFASFASISTNFQLDVGTGAPMERYILYFYIFICNQILFVLHTVYYDITISCLLYIAISVCNTVINCTYIFTAVLVSIFCRNTW